MDLSINKQIIPCCTRVSTLIIKFWFLFITEHPNIIQMVANCRNSEAYISIDVIEYLLYISKKRNCTVVTFAIYIIDSVPTVHYSNINGIITVEYSNNVLTH
jgi:hypothetical protein